MRIRFAIVCWNYYAKLRSITKNIFFGKNVLYILAISVQSGRIRKFQSPGILFLQKEKGEHTEVYPNRCLVRTSSILFCCVVLRSLIRSTVLLRLFCSNCLCWRYLPNSPEFPWSFSVFVWLEQCEEEFSRSPSPTSYIGERVRCTLSFSPSEWSRTRIRAPLAPWALSESVVWAIASSCSLALTLRNQDRL